MKRLFSAALLIGATGASVLMGGEYRLVNGALAAGIIGLALFIAHTRTRISRKVRVAVVAATIAGALAALIVHTSRQRVCTATNASGQRVVIGTELTRYGIQYKEKNPNEDNNMILEALGARAPELAWTAESIRRCRIALALSGALWIPLFGVAAVAAASGSVIGRSPQPVPPVRYKPRAFISYNHDDSSTALRLRDVLQRGGVDVILDRDNMTPGERISDFIRRSIRECDVVVSVISSRSLLSTWVASETVGSISRNKWGQEVTLIACYLDDGWLAPEFRLKCTQQIDERLQRIEALLSEYAAKKIDTADLNEEKTRLYDLRNNLGSILATFKDSLCLDLRETEFNKSAERLVNTIQRAGPLLDLGCPLDR